MPCQTRGAVRVAPPCATVSGGAGRSALAFSRRSRSPAVAAARAARCRSTRRRSGPARRCRYWLQARAPKSRVRRSSVLSGRRSACRCRGRHLARQEVRPAPGRCRDVAPVGVEGHGFLRGQKRPAELTGRGVDWVGAARRVCRRPEKQMARRRGDGPVQREVQGARRPAVRQVRSAEAPTSNQDEAVRVLCAHHP